MADVKASLQSPSQTVGPFFHDALIKEADRILINNATQGEKIILTGTVFDGDGVPVPDAMVEIWQADANGVFNHPDDPGQSEADPNFKGFGRSDTLKDGQYFFQTIKPGCSSLDGTDQSPYIRLRIFARGMLIHASTRVYFSDEENQHEPVFNAVPEERKHTLVAKHEPSSNPPGYRFDIHLQGDNETVFFDA